MALKIAVTTGAVSFALGWWACSRKKVSDNDTDNAIAAPGEVTPQKTVRIESVYGDVYVYPMGRIALYCKGYTRPPHITGHTHSAVPHVQTAAGDIVYVFAPFAWAFP